MDLNIVTNDFPHGRVEILEQFLTVDLAEEVGSCLTANALKLIREISFFNRNMLNIYKYFLNTGFIRPNLTYNKLIKSLLELKC